MSLKISQNERQERELLRQIKIAEQAHQGQWRRYGVIETRITQLKVKLESLWERQKVAARLKAKMEIITDAKRYLSKGLKSLTEQIRISVRLLVDYYLPIGFRNLKAKEHQYSGAFFGIGKRIASGGKYTWRQFTFWQSLAHEAGISV